MGLLGGDGYKFEAEAFEQITNGIKAATAELKELGFDVEAQLGRGFDELALDSMECGDDAVASALDSFCERWGWGVRTMMQDANEFSRKLNLTAGLYYEQEQYASTTLKVATNAAMGDPSLSAEEIKKKSWGDIGADNPFTQIRDADWDPTSAESLEAGARVAKTAHDLGQDVASVPDRFENGGEDPAGKQTTLGSPRPGHTGGGDDK
ncbi:hypothetical protein [Streptomyces sp. NPDC101393]|uniref:hypothetical protein n=1 Tax=Streptomyces sp. NPDC101393 TaxID=3366141 RepID=UPI0037FD6CA0